MIFKDVFHHTNGFSVNTYGYTSPKDYYVRSSSGVTLYSVRKTLGEKHPLPGIFSRDSLLTLMFSAAAGFFGYCTLDAAKSAVSAYTLGGHIGWALTACIPFVPFIILLILTGLFLSSIVYNIRALHTQPLPSNILVSVIERRWRELSNQVRGSYFIEAIDARTTSNPVLGRAICSHIDAYFDATDNLNAIAHDPDSEESAQKRAEEMIESFAKLYATPINSIIEEERRPQVEKENAQRQKKLEEAEAARIEAERAAEQRREQSARFAAKVLREAERKLQSEQANVS